MLCTRIEFTLSWINPEGSSCLCAANGARPRARNVRLSHVLPAMLVLVIAPCLQGYAEVAERSRQIRHSPHTEFNHIKFKSWAHHFCLQIFLDRCLMIVVRVQCFDPLLNAAL
jgi:hypothetical protein